MLGILGANWNKPVKKPSDKPPFSFHPLVPVNVIT
jgi:hypothetical protein